MKDTGLGRTLMHTDLVEVTTTRVVVPFCDSDSTAVKLTKKTLAVEVLWNKRAHDFICERTAEDEFGSGGFHAGKITLSSESAMNAVSKEVDAQTK